MTSVCVKEEVEPVCFWECTSVILAAGTVLPSLSGDEEEKEQVVWKNLDSFKKWIVGSLSRSPHMHVSHMLAFANCI